MKWDLRLPRLPQRPLPTMIAHRTVRFSIHRLLLYHEMLYEDIDLEPASALATKISRAHDNPSPPPKMQPLDDPIFPAPTEHTHHYDSPVPKAFDSAIVDRPSPRLQASVSSPARETRTHPDHRPAASASPLASSADLIVFDDDRLPAVPKVAVRHHTSVYVNLSP